MSSLCDGLALKFWQRKKKALPMSQKGQVAQGHQRASKFQDTYSLSIMLVGVESRLRNSLSSVRDYWARFGARGKRTNRDLSNDNLNTSQYFSVNMKLSIPTSASSVLLDDLASLVIHMLRPSNSCSASAYAQFYVGRETLISKHI